LATMRWSQLPNAASPRNLGSARQARTKASWATSSASLGERRMRSASAWARGPCRSTRSRKASSSPAWARRTSSRSSAWASPPPAAGAALPPAASGPASGPITDLDGMMPSRGFIPCPRRPGRLKPTALPGGSYRMRRPNTVAGAPGGRSPQPGQTKEAALFIPYFSVGEFVPIIALAIPIVAIIGGITAGIIRTLERQRLIELAQRERIAAIERGVDPAKLTPLPVEALDDEPETWHMNQYDRDRRRAQGLMIWGIVTLAV